MPHAVQQTGLEQIATGNPVVGRRRQAENAVEKRRPVGREDTLPTLHQRPAAASTVAKRGPSQQFTNRPNRGSPLYTPEQRLRRDATAWTLVQGILAPVQFAIFLTSLGLVAHYLLTGQGFAWAAGSIVIKTLALYAIMITGAIWEREVFGVYLFARPFFWEDVFSMLVIALHTAYLVALATDALTPRALMALALAAYATYVINAGQFILKLRAARLQRDSESAPAALEMAS
jgi:3-vinyl bacteriochlorophyllide hydratase